MKRIAILVLLVFVIATSLALTSSIASASHGGRPCPEGTRPLVEAPETVQRGGPFYTCVSAGSQQ
jgi:hypothetical protein